MRERTRRSKGGFGYQARGAVAARAEVFIDNAASSVFTAAAAGGNRQFVLYINQ
jgi:hypothetical protein